MSDEQVLEKTKIYFIRHPDGPLDNIEKFLRHRDYETHSASDVKEAFAGILKVQPQYVFICLDHPNEKINAIPKLLLQSLPVIIVPYVNGTSMNSIRMIQTSQFEYKLFPPNSSPSFLRLLTKIAKEQAQGNNLASKQKKDAGQIINASNQTTPESKFYRIDGNDPQTNQWNLKQSPSGQGDSDDIIVSQKNSGQNYVIGGGKGPDSSGHFNPSAPNGNDSTYSGNGSQSAKNSSTQNSINSMNSALGNNFNGSANSNSGHGNNFQPGTNSATENTFTPSSGSSKPNSAGGGSGSAAMSSSGTNFESSKQSQTETSSNFKKTRSVPTKLGKNRKQTNFEKSAEDVLNQITESPFSDLDILKVQKVSNATCFAIDSAKFTGYLVAAFAGEKKFDMAFLSLMKQRLKEFLITRGEDFDPSEKMEVQIIEVDFEDWAVEQAEFLKKSVHQGNEMAMAFFPTQHPRLTILPSENKDMLKVSIDDIDENRAVKFNVYIYLAVNKRYILYTPKGGRLGKPQKTRLKSKGVSDVHFHKNEAHQFKTYQAENYLNGKITELHDAAKVTAMPSNNIKVKKAA